MPPPNQQTDIPLTTNNDTDIFGCCGRWPAGLQRCRHLPEVLAVHEHRHPHRGHCASRCVACGAGVVCTKWLQMHSNPKVVKLASKGTGGAGRTGLLPAPRACRPPPSSSTGPSFSPHLHAPTPIIRCLLAVASPPIVPLYHTPFLRICSPHPQRILGSRTCCGYIPGGAVSIVGLPTSAPACCRRYIRRLPTCEGRTPPIILAHSMLRHSTVHPLVT